VSAPVIDQELAARGSESPSRSRAFVLGSSIRWRFPPLLDVVCLGVISLLTALPLRGLYASTGSNMEEGFMLVFPERMIQGDIPNVDFLHLYGPGSLDALVGWYGLFGHSLASERTFGLLQHLGVIFGIYALTRAWGRAAATFCAVVCMFIVITPIGLSALAWEGGIAFGVWSLVFAVRSINIVDGVGEESERSNARRTALVAGLLAGLALSFRPDLILALAIAHGWLLWRRNRAAWKPVAVGLLVGLAPMLVHLVIAGLGPSFRGMVLDPVFHLRPGRELPRPPTWNHLDGTLQFVAEVFPPWWGLPAISAEHQLFVWFFVMIAVIVLNLVVARKTLRSGDSTGRGVALMMGALFGLGISPQAMQRPDSTHLAWVVCVSFSILPVALIEILRRRRPRLTHGKRLVSVMAIVVAMLLVVCPFFTFRMWVLHTRVSLGNMRVPFNIHRHDREFWLGDYEASLAAQEVIDDLDRMAKPGERLLVGPADLARTIYSDVMFYWLFPELTPATYYIEMDPGLADKEGSSLADDARSADWVLLTNFWTGWNEPNASEIRGSDAPNQVVANDFCKVGEYQKGLVILYHKCPPGQKGDGISPAEVGEKSALERAAGG
jgi:hypothetical protein